MREVFSELFLVLLRLLSLFLSRVISFCHVCSLISNLNIVAYVFVVNFVLLAHICQIRTRT